MADNMAIMMYGYARMTFWKVISPTEDREASFPLSTRKVVLLGLQVAENVSRAIHRQE